MQLTTHGRRSAGTARSQEMKNWRAAIIALEQQTRFSADSHSAETKCNLIDCAQSLLLITSLSHLRPLQETQRAYANRLAAAKIPRNCFDTGLAGGVLMPVVLGRPFRKNAISFARGHEFNIDLRAAAQRITYHVIWRADGMGRGCDLIGLFSGIHARA